MKLNLWFISFILILLLCSSVSAFIANSSTVMTSYTDTQFSGKNYMPYQYEILFIAIAFICLIGMKINQEIEVLLGIISTIAFGVSAWFAPYLCIYDVFTVVDNRDGSATVLYTQFVTPEPILQVLMIVCFLFSFIYLIYVIFLRDADKGMSASDIINNRG